MIHIDVMDGHFVPPITMGPNAVAALRDLGAHLDVHLMIERPERQVAEFVKAGANTITIHAEATPHLDYTLEQIREGRLPPEPRRLPVDAARRLRRGGGRPGPVHDGQPRLGRPGVHPPLARPHPRDCGRSIGDEADIEVDGGIDAETAGPCAEAGATVFVAGTAVFGARDPATAYAELVTKIGCS